MKQKVHLITQIKQRNKKKAQNLMRDNLIAFNFTKKTIDSCEHEDHVDGARQMIEAYANLYRQNPVTAFRYRELKLHLKYKREKLNEDRLS